MTPYMQDLITTTIVALVFLIAVLFSGPISEATVKAADAVAAHRSPTPITTPVECVCTIK